MPATMVASSHQFMAPPSLVYGPRVKSVIQKPSDNVTFNERSFLDDRESGIRRSDSKIVRTANLGGNIIHDVYHARHSSISPQTRDDSGSLKNIRATVDESRAILATLNIDHGNRHRQKTVQDVIENTSFDYTAED